MRTYQLVVDVNDFDSEALVFDDMELLEQEWLSSKYLKLTYICDISVCDDILEVEGVYSLLEDGELVYNVFSGE